MEDTDDLKAVSEANRRFTAALHQTLRTGGENLFYSPYSIMAALALVHAGAEGQTRAELDQALGLGATGDRVHQELAQLARVLEERRKPPEKPSRLAREQGADSVDQYGFQFNTACNLWIQKGYGCRQAYLNLLNEIYGLAPGELDFAAAPGEACQAINGWANDMTQGLIPEIVTPAHIAPLTRLILANAVYFKAAWADCFEAEWTISDDFLGRNGEKTPIQMMRIGYNFQYWESGEMQVVALPYAGHDLKFVVLLPRGDRFDKVEQGLDADSLDRLLFAEHKRQMVHLGLPRSRMDCDLRLSDALGKLGVRRLFSESAELSALSAEPGIQIGEVFHKAHLSVDEAGTEAAAVTVMDMVGSMPPEHWVEMTVNRPFLYFIVDQPTKTVLFAGRMLRP